MTTLLNFAKRVKAAGGTCWYVGGCVRDKIIGLTPKDIDIVVENLSISTLLLLDVLKAPYEEVGVSFGVIKAKFSFPDGVKTVDISVPRKEVSTGDGHKDFDITTNNVTLLEDAKRRDFTMNAIYENVLTGEIYDPINGRKHLLDGYLEVTSRDSFKDDPLRMLRAVQFVSRFDLVCAENVRDCLTVCAPLVTAVSPERVAIELKKLLLSDQPQAGLNLMNNTGLLRVVIPELDALVGMEQPGKFHNADAFQHTLRVVQSVRPDINMRFAALFHDLGKAKTKGINPDGQISFHGHESVGVDLANQVIDRLKLFTLQWFDREMVCILIGNHMFGMSDKNSPSALRRLVRKVGGIERMHDLVQLRIADKLGGAYPNTIWKHLEFFRKVMDAVHEVPAASVKDLKVDGNDVMNILNIDAGPRVGQILKSLFELVENGEINNDNEELSNKIQELE